MRPGFTLIEMLVVMSIIVIMTAFVSINWRSSGEALALNRSAHKVARDMRAVSELALSSRSFTDAGCASFSGYGIHMDSSASTKTCYLIYAECNGSEAYQGPDCDSTSGMSPDKQIRIFELEKGVRIKSISPNPQFSVLFIPPDPQIIIKPGVFTQAQVILESINNPANTRTITVTKKGVIDID